jgi:two-component system, LytTR family, sensor kinase
MNSLQTKGEQRMFRNRKALTYWLCQILFWAAQSGFVLFFVLLNAPEGRPRWKYFMIFGVSAAFAILLTHAYRVHIRRKGWLALTVSRVLPRAAFASVLMGIIITIPQAVLWFLLFGRGNTDEIVGWLPYALGGWSFDVFAWGLMYFRVKERRRVRQLEIESLQLAVVAKDAQLQALVSQINPHFLFNCLNSLRALIVENPAKAQNMVTALSSLLRYSLQAGKAMTVPLETELEMVETYLRLESIRFEERLSSATDSAPDTLQIQVPVMLVQSLVENGVKHGIEKLKCGGEIRIASLLQNGSLKIRVTNPGQLSTSHDSTHIGLQNSRERLRLLYGDSASLVLRNDGADSVAAEISIPSHAEATLP